MSLRPGGEIRLAEEPAPRARRRRGRFVLLAMGLVLAVGAWIGARTVHDLLTPPRCQASAAGRAVTFDPEQMGNAATITALGMKRGLPARAATIALATAIQESKLRNIRFGDRDSVGLFQQRPSQGWGTEEQILDPEYSANKFYDELVKIKGYQDMEITKVAQKIQRSAYPEAYAAHEWEGRVLASTLAGHTEGGFGCRLEAADMPADTARLKAQLSTEFGLTPTVSGTTATMTAGSRLRSWALGHWLVAKAEQLGIVEVIVGDREWVRVRGDAGFTWAAADAPQREGTVRVTLRR